MFCILYEHICHDIDLSIEICYVMPLNLTFIVTRVSPILEAGKMEGSIIDL